MSSICCFDICVQMQVLFIGIFSLDFLGFVPLSGAKFMPSRFDSVAIFALAASVGKRPFASV